MNNLFNGMFGKVAPGMCRISASGGIAIKTSSGYKSYNVETGKLTNCDNFAFDIGEDMFYIMPTNKVKKSDIIIASGRPRCVIEVSKNEIKAFSYEDGTIETIVPERHMLMGKQYFYGKIVSMLGNMMSEKNGGMKNFFKYKIMSDMMHGNSDNMMPMMLMMNGGNMFDGMFDFEDEEDDEEEKDDE